MLKQKEKDILKQLRKDVKDKIIRQNIKSPLFSIQCDYKTKKLKLNYSFSKYKGLNENKEKVFKKQQKDFYLNNITINKGEFFLRNLSKYIDLLKSKIKEDHEKSLLKREQSLIYWSNIYTSSLNRFDFKSIKKSSLKGDKESLDGLIKFCNRFNNKMLDIWEWPRSGGKFIYRYMEYKQKDKTGNKKLWSDTTVNSHYQRIRAFFNWLSYKVELFPSNVLGRLIFKKNSRAITIFNSEEINKIKNFIDQNKYVEEWKWFVEMLVVMIETGLQVEILCLLKIKNIVLKDKSLCVDVVKNGKTNKIIFPLSKYCWKIISSLILNKNNTLRTDKKLIFHNRYYRKSKKENQLFENLDKGFSSNGFRKKFNDMVMILGISNNLTPQSCRHYYVIEMLKDTNGDITLVSNKTGISTRVLFEKYISFIDIKREDKGVKIFSEEDFETKTKTKRLKDGGVSVPFMVTREMVRELLSMGYNKKEINKMKSEEAHEIIINS